MKLNPWRRQRATPAAPRCERDGSALAGPNPSVADGHDASAGPGERDASPGSARDAFARAEYDAFTEASIDASRCTGTTIRNGTQCRLDASPGTDRCVFHPRKEQPE